MSAEVTNNPWNKVPFKTNDAEVELQLLSKKDTKVQGAVKNIQTVAKNTPINENYKKDREGLSQQSLNALDQISKALKIEEGDEDILLAKYGFLQYYLNHYEKGLTTFNLISFVANKLCPSIFGGSPISEAVNACNQIAIYHPKVASSFEDHKAFSLNINEAVVRKNLDQFLLKFN